MAKIRTVKPELFRHEGLYELESASGLPVRLSFAGLFTACDREGRFKWRPRELKLDVLPFDQLDFSRVLDALLSRGFLIKYRVGDAWIGQIPTFTAHQVINNKERASVLPSIEQADEYIDAQVLESSAIDLIDLTRDARVDDASLTPLNKDQGEGKGSGRELEVEGKGLQRVNASRPAKPKTENQQANGETWQAYADAYFNRYGTEPVRNASVNSQIANVVKRVGIESAPGVAAYYVGMNRAFYVQKLHPVGLLLADCESIHTQWATNRQVTDTRARQIDQTQSNMNTADEAYLLFMQNQREE
jgi:hypothetical protein